MRCLPMGFRIAAGLATVGLVSGTGTADGTDLDATWKNGFHLKSSDGGFSATIGGRIMQDWAFINEGDGVPADFRADDGVEFRRARLYMSGLVHGSVEFKTQWDFAGGEVTPKDVYLGLKGLPGVGGVRVGNINEPFSLDELTSSKYITFMERGLTTEFAPGRNPGVMAHNSFGDGRGTMAVGLYRTDDDNGTSTGDAEYSQTARITFLPVRDGGGGLLHVGAAVSHRVPPGGDVRYRFRPENHLGARVLSSGTIPADDVLLVCGEVAAIVGPISFQGEYVSASIAGPAIEPTVGAFSASASVFLTGEQRTYKSNTFSRTKVKRNFDAKKGGSGAWEAAVRISRVDLDDESNGLTAGTLTDYTAALNWYLNPTTRVMMNYVIGQVDTPEWEGDVNTAQARFQLDF